MPSTPGDRGQPPPPKRADTGTSTLDASTLDSPRTIGIDEAALWGLAQDELADTQRTEMQVVTFTNVAAEPRIPVLEILSGTRTPTHFVLEASTVIGRGSGCDIVLRSSLVSRRHCRILCMDDGGMEVEDLGSTNKTLVDGQSMEARSTVALKGESRIQIGPFEARIFRRTLAEVERINEIADLIRASMFDALTSLLSRAEFDRVHRQARAWSIGDAGVPRAVCLISIEDEAEIEDRFGIHAADEVVATSGQIIRAALPDSMDAYRYSSSEFLLLFDETAQRAAAFVEGVVQNHLGRHPWGEISVGLSVRFCAGVARLEEGEHILGAVGRAQRALAMRRRTATTGVGLAPDSAGVLAADGGTTPSAAGRTSRPTRRYYSVFISYAHQDAEFAQRVHAALKAHGVACWIDSENMLPGDPVLRPVSDLILCWDRVVVCCSKSSLRSWFVETELAIVFKKEADLRSADDRNWQLVIPLDLDGHLHSTDVQSAIAVPLRLRIAADFKEAANEDKFQSSLSRVLKALRSDMGRSGLPPRQVR